MLFLFLFFILILFFLFWSRPHWGLYLAVFLAPFLGLVVDFSRFEWAQAIPYLKNIDAPAADFAAMFLLGVVGVKIIWRRFVVGAHGHAPLQQVGFFYFLPFLIVGALSLFNVPYDQFNSSLKYLLRPILFFYLMWVILPMVLIDSEKVLERVVKVVFWTGVLSALMGLVSLFISPSIFGFWRRAGPLEFWGLAPLAYNHNLLAEWLVAVAPLGFWLYIVETHGHASLQKIQKFYFFGFILITAIAMLTFARAAWLALIVQMAIYFWFYRKAFLSRHPEFISGSREMLKRVQHDIWPVIVIIPLLIYMLFFSLSPIVRSSNATRLDLTGIAWTYFKLHPWLGNGVGTFVPLVEQTRLFTVEYGDPLDAHGVLQKLIAEQGLAGVITFGLFVGWLIHRLYRGIRAAEEKYRLLLLCLFLSVIGSLVYQLFNTSYYNAHLWLPVGVALAGVKLKGYRV